MHIISGSRVLTFWIKHEYYTTFYASGQIYYGFGYPITCMDINSSTEDIKMSAQLFTSFIEGILAIYDTNDLMNLGKEEYINYPKVSVNINQNGDIISIYNQDNGMMLTKSNKNYQIQIKK